MAYLIQAIFYIMLMVNTLIFLFLDLIILPWNFSHNY
jgi:hypothetical protein